MRPPAALIVGGGPAGAAAAISLARAGLSAVVLERERETGDPLCGGFLSWETLNRLAALGVEADALAPRPVERLVLFAGRLRAEARLPARAGGVSRHRLDTLLLARAVAAGAGVERGATVRALEPGGATLDDGGELRGDAVLLATGKHELRGHARPQPAGDPPLGLRWRLAPSPALDRLVDGAIELHLFRGGYAGLVRQEESVNLCLATRRGRLRRAEGRPDRLLAELAAECPAIAARLDASRAIGRPQAVANVPYGWQAAPGDDPFYRIGDQAGVIPSLAGEGLALALQSGAVAAAAIVAGTPPASFQDRLRNDQRRPIALAGVLWHMAEHPASARAMIGAVRLAPWLARTAARLTRV